MAAATATTATTTFIQEYAHKLTDAETRWALEIKQAVEARSDEIKALSDYEYAQYALVSRGDVTDALRRIQGLQEFRDEYKIDDTLEQGMDLLRKFTIQQPWFVLDVEYEAPLGHFVCVYDYGVLDPSKVDFPEDWRIYLGGLYYIFQILQSNLGAVREGIVHIVECEGMNWRNFCVEFARRNWYHMIEYYPHRNKEVSWLHTSVIANMMHAQYKSMMGQEASIIRVGCQYEGYDGRLDEVFKMPHPTVAEARLLARYETFLITRFHNQQSFQLPASIPETDDDEDSDDDTNSDNESEGDEENH
ncbi:expressed unknown protein [Seminavis robusta]|uniref:CRAL-TRIO domain-containing protein n=1 Tax=Seminavis robusta TaxID=568900 RepID=A0A9N8DNK1_9STRA|nr:expressed unknown protein [Seminavis robusta]|eukprot:Sro228_g092820.1 n/a (304) ;mRNA; f:82720-83631